jgi:hypothetical protein
MKAPRNASPCHQMNDAMAHKARAELMLLGVATMNGFQLAHTRFSLSCLRDGSRSDDGAMPPFRRCWCLRDENRRAVAIFLESELAFEAVAKEYGLTIHLCPTDPTWAVLARAGSIIYWPQTQEVRRKWQR